MQLPRTLLRFPINSACRICLTINLGRATTAPPHMCTALRRRPILRLSRTSLRQLRPGRVLDGIDVPLGVRHQPEDQAARVADAGDVVDAAVGVVAGTAPPAGEPSGAGVDQRDLIVVPQRLGERPRRRGRTSLRRARSAARAALEAGRPDALRLARREVDPAVDEPAAVVVGQRAGLPGAPGESPGSRSVLTSTWNPLQMPMTGLPASMNSRSASPRWWMIWLARIRPAAMSSP